MERKGGKKTTATTKKRKEETKPPWNNDTRIDGYDDVDENGRYRERQQAPLKSKSDKDQISLRWSSSLRGGVSDVSK